VEDLRAAIRFARANASEYRIDTEKIIASGESAGAIAALALAYASDFQYEGDSGNPGYPSHPNGVISKSGALKQ